VPNYLGYFGEEVFGSGYYGILQNCLSLNFSIINQKLIDLLLQVPENSQRVDIQIFAGGVDISESCESITISQKDKSKSGSINITYAGESEIYLVQGQTITAKAIFRFSDNTTFTNRIFDGVITTSLESKGSLNKTVSIYGLDAAEIALSKQPLNTTWTGTALSLLQSELNNAGLLISEIDITDYTITAATFSFETVWDLIKAVAGAKQEATCFYLPNGSYQIRALGKTSSWNFTTKAYAYLSQVSSSKQGYKEILVTGSTGSYVKIDGGNSYGSNYSENSAFISSESDLGVKALAVKTKSTRNERSLQVPLNPLVKLGDTITITPTDEAVFTAIVSGINHYCQWTGTQTSPGCYTTLTVEVQ